MHRFSLLPTQAPFLPTPFVISQAFLNVYFLHPDSHPRCVNSIEKMLVGSFSHEACVQLYTIQRVFKHKKITCFVRKSVMFIQWARPSPSAGHFGFIYLMILSVSRQPSCCIT